ncbi:NAD(P)/FAD-dependent oxidoreductase [Lapidilactobacillus luobeiensis]|uniref:NAD(P)/FAD-dependent oxidoreductase n=1 Tax=Lapidilactobacillus luobeiensis TaxID=2950371 RepID=UPI0021C377C0|nr:NAD(P)/FAD-dependent oxidoreductase [Lapidilactobacillus luobeiensis]
MDHKYDLLIIGGGPVGLFAAYFAGMRNANVAIIESLPQLGGQAAALFPEKIVYDVGGIPAIKAKDLIKQQQQQLSLFPPKIFLQTSAQDIQQDEDGDYTVTTDQGVLHARAIIVAIGTGAFSPRRLAFAYDPQLESAGYLNYFVQDLESYRDQDVVVAGGGDSAIDWALALEPIAHQVTIVHRRDQFRGLESSVSKLEQSTIQIKTPFLITQADQAVGKIQLDLKRVKTNEHEILTTDKLLVNYGFTADSRVLRKWGLTLSGPKIKVDTKMATNRPKIYAIGDAITYPGKLDLLAVGYAEAPIAVTTALQTIYPDKIQPVHSTSLFEH